jgi:signal peptidase
VTSVAASAYRARRRRASALRSLVSVALWAGLGLVVIVGAAVLVPIAFQLRPYTVLSGSMEPAIATGDVVLTETIAPGRARVGDVVTFRDPSRERRLITHRVRSIRIARGVAEVVTRGDANQAPERWTVAADGRIGRVVYKVPRVGRLAAAGGTPPGRILLIVVPAVILGAAELRRVWRPARA